jgi:UDP-2,4-diacetamido-2,4,6-trideoxy-beta-L-altropyranose hydrolase
MARLMARADLALGAGGSSAWERCYMGLPTLTITVAHNQEGPARAAHRAGLARLVGRSAEVTAATLAEALSWALHSPTEIRALGERCLAFLPARRTPLPDQLLDALNEVPDEP